MSLSFHVNYPFFIKLTCTTRNPKGEDFLMKKTLCSILTLLIFLTLTSLPNSLAQEKNSPENTVRIIYFLPSDRESYQNIDTRIDGLIKDVQNFYANEMERHGYGRKTFRLETNANGKAQVHHINGKFSAVYYNAEDGAFGKILAEIGERFDTSENIYFIVADVTYPSSYWRGGGQAHTGGSTIVYIPFESLDESGQVFVSKYHAGHEIGHSFGLQHDFRHRTDFSEADIMSYTVGIDFNNRRLSRCAAEWLYVHRYFNPNQTSLNEPSTIQMLPPVAYPPNAINLRFMVNDPDGLHQAQLMIPREDGFSLHDCKSLNGKKDSIVEFITTELTATANNEVSLGIIDVHGNFKWESFFIQIDDIERVDRIVSVESVASKTLRKVSGDNQEGYLNRRLINPFVVTVRDADDEPVAGVQVTFQVITGNGNLSVTDPWTDSEGQARTYFTPGSSQGEYRVTASVEGVSDPVIFTATLNKETLATATPWRTLTGHKDKVLSVAYSPDGSLIATGSSDKTIRLWDGATGQHKKVLMGHTGDVSSVAFSPDGATLASGSSDDTIQLWDIETRKNKLEFNGRSFAVTAVAYSSDGSEIASGTLEGDIHLWDAVTGQHKTSLTGHEGNVSSIVFSPDRLLIASGGTDRIIQLWDAVTGQQRETITEHSLVRGDGIEVAFNHDGSILASTGAWDLTVRLWNPTTGQHLKTLSGHKTGVYAVAFRPDEAMLATGSFDGEIRLWEPVTGEPQKILIGHTETVRSLAFSPNGDMLVSGSSDHTVCLWEITPFLSQQPIDGKEKIAISEIMLASNEDRLPQWIELNNRSNTHAVNLEGWKLEIQNYRLKDFNGHPNVTLIFKKKSINPQTTLLIVSKQGRFSNRLGDEQIYNLSVLHPNLQDMVLSEEGFYLKLSNVADELIDEVGNLDGKGSTHDEPAWSLPTSLTEDGVRTSMVRRQDYGVPRLGTQASGWISAVNTNLATSTTTYYGHPDDIGAPGIESGGALPVSLSRFRAELIESGVIIKWATESELDNAGFNIRRSETKNGEFKIVNPQLIQGAGTTSEQHEYTWTDTTAKPNVVYYYRMEDVSHAGVRKQLATVRMRGYVSASGKLTTKWGDLKVQE